MTELRPCTCVHKYQQEKYGTLRVHNSGKRGTQVEYRCTVCGSAKLAGKEEVSR